MTQGSAGGAPAGAAVCRPPTSAADASRAERPGPRAFYRRGFGYSASPMAIPVWDYRSEYDLERDDILAAVDHVLRSGRLILGDSVRGFEQELAAYCGVSHGVGVNSGTDAL